MTSTPPPPRYPLRIIKITSDEPSIFITRRDPTKTPKHPRLSLPPPTPSSDPSAPSSSPTRRKLFTAATTSTSPSRKRTERSESIVCLSSPQHAGPSKTRSEDRSVTREDLANVSMHRRRRLDDSDDEVIPPLSEALRLGSSAVKRSRNMGEEIGDLRVTARDWIEAEDRISAKKKEKINRVARLVELQSRRRRPLVSPSPSPSTAPASPFRHARARDSSVGAMETSDSVTQPTTPYDPTRQSRGLIAPRAQWSTSPMVSPIAHSKEENAELWPMLSKSESPRGAEEEEAEVDHVDQSHQEACPPSSVHKGNGKVTLADLFDNEEDKEQRVRMPLPAKDAAVEDEDDDRDELAEDEDDRLGDPTYADNEVALSGDDHGSDEYEDDDLDDALANVDPDSFSPPLSDSSRAKASRSEDTATMDVDLDPMPPIVDTDAPLTQSGVGGFDFFADAYAYDLPLLPAVQDDNEPPDLPDIPSPITLIHELPEKYRDFFNEHWRRGADAAKRRATQPEPPRAKLRAPTRKKSWPGRGRGRWRGRGRGAPRRK